MSNERSPRDVCSITIGINGLIGAPLNFWRVDWSFQTAARAKPMRPEGGTASGVTQAGSLLPGVHSFGFSVGFSLSGVQIASRAAACSGGTRSTSAVMRSSARATAPLHDGVELAKECSRPRLNQRTGDLDLRCLNEPFERGAPKDLVHLRLHLLADPLLHLGAELRKRVELGGGARELVVELGQHLLLDLLDRGLDAHRLVPARPLELEVLRLTRTHPDQLPLELGKE